MGEILSLINTGKSIIMINGRVILKKQHGFSIIQVMIAAAILSMVALGATKLLKQMNKANLSSITISSVGRAQKDFIQAIEDDVAWQATVEAPENAAVLGCLIDLNDGDDCTDTTIGGGNFFRLLTRKDADGVSKVIYDSVNPVQGLTVGGATCTEFDSVNGNDRCPIRINLTVKLNCPPGGSPCKDPSVVISAQFIYKSKTIDQSIPFNESKHSFVFTRHVVGGPSSDCPAGPSGLYSVHQRYICPAAIHLEVVKCSKYRCSVLFATCGREIMQCINGSWKSIIQGGDVPIDRGHGNHD